VPHTTRDAVQIYRQLLGEARPYWPHLLLLAVVSLLATPIALFTPVPLKIAVDSIAGGAPVPAFYRAVLPPAVLNSVTGLVVFTALLMMFVSSR